MTERGLPRLPLSVAMAAAMAALAACMEPGTEAVGFEVRDSAGIEIVESSTPSLTGAAAWTVEPEPILRLGAVDGPEPEVFTRLWDAAVLPDGRIVVVDELAMDVRIFDAEGRHLGSFGGPGDGPAEFGGPPFIAAAPDGTIRTWDGGHLRLSRFDPDGTLIDQVTLQAQLSELGVTAFRNGRVWDVTPEGTVLSTGPVRPGREPGLQDRHKRVVVIEDRGARTRDLGTFLSGRTFSVQIDRGRIGVSHPYMSNVAVGLDGSGGIALGSEGGWQVRLVGPDGGVRRILRAAIAQTPVTPARVAEARERALDFAGRSPLTPRQAEDAFEELPMPDSVPVVGAILGREGTLWVGRRTGDWWELGRYDVFGPEGRWLTTVALPAEVAAVLEVSGDRLLTQVSDEMEVQYLHVYRLRRGG